MTLDSSDLLTTRVSCSNTQSPTALSDSSCYKCLHEENSVENKHKGVHVVACVGPLLESHHTLSIPSHCFLGTSTFPQPEFLATSFLTIVVGTHFLPDGCSFPQCIKIRLCPMTLLVFIRCGLCSAFTCCLSSTTLSNGRRQSSEISLAETSSRSWAMEKWRLAN